jgi:pimeloyl-ACP methyl ester carboxylesterase
MPNPTRRDFKVRSVDGLNIGVREVAPAARDQNRTPVLMLHGTRIPGASEYDLPVPNGSLAEDLAREGHHCFVPDARGYGASDRPEAMSRPPSESKPFARCLEIARDIDAATDALLQASGHNKVAVMGWGIGATAVLNYAALWPEKVSHVILYNAMYGGGETHARYRGFALEDPDAPGRFNARKFGGYSYNTLEMLLDKWDESIPVADKDSWRDPEVAKAFAQALIDGDPTAKTRNPPSYRCPNGMLEDSFYIGKGHKLVHANQVYSKVLIIRPELDYFSRPEDVAALKADLVNAEQVHVWEPKNATHYVLLDRPERGRTDTIRRIRDFLDH